MKNKKNGKDKRSLFLRIQIKLSSFTFVVLKQRISEGERKEFNI